MVKDEIVGTYWYVINCGERYITQGNKPVKSKSGGFKRSGPGMGWLCLDYSEDSTSDGNKIINSQDFKGLRFPEVEPEIPIEIEIVKSGRIYTYDSQG